MTKLKKIGDTIFDYDDCANWDTECPRDCNFHGCMSYSPKVYKTE